MPTESPEHVLSDQLRLSVRPGARRSGLPSIPQRRSRHPHVYPALGVGTPAGPNGSIVRSVTGDDLFVISAGTRRRLPDLQTVYLEGYSEESVRDVPEDVLMAVPEGAPVASFSYVVATGSCRSRGGGHMVSASATLDLRTGLITGTVTTTNHVMLEGYCSGVMVLLRDRAGDPVRPHLPALVRFRVGMRGPFNDPATRTDTLCFSIGAAAAGEVCSFDLVITDAPDRLDGVVARYGEPGETGMTGGPFLAAVAPFAVHVPGRGATTTA